MEGNAGQVKAAEDGSGVTFFSQAGIPGGVGSQEFPTFMSSRHGSTWSTQGLLPPQYYGDVAKVRGFSSNLTYVAVEAVKSVPTAVIARSISVAFPLALTAWIACHAQSLPGFLHASAIHDGGLM